MLNAISVSLIGFWFNLHGTKNKQMIYQNYKVTDIKIHLSIIQLFLVRNGVQKNILINEFEKIVEIEKHFC